MKFTKLLALALVVVMAVFALASCGEPAETTAETPETTEAPETQAPETQAPETTGCTHKNSLKKTGNDKTPTCTEEGYVERKCTKCGEIVQEPIDKIAHAYSEVKSLDGKYVRKVCGMCKEVIVVDEAGAVVADASAIAFPLFAGTFEGVDTIADVAALFDGFGITPTFANIVKNDPNGEIYLNIPSGNVAVAPNGCLDVIDETAQLVGKAFTLTFLARYEEAPTAPTAFLTWTVDGNAQVLLSGDSKGNYLNAAGDVLATSNGKGWDSFKVVFAADGSYTISLDDVQIGTGSVVTTGATSSIRFFDNKNQFEAYLDEIIIAK
jgi:hypothetical protein